MTTRTKYGKFKTLDELKDFCYDIENQIQDEKNVSNGDLLEIIFAVFDFDDMEIEYEKQIELLNENIDDLQNNVDDLKYVLNDIYSISGKFYSIEDSPDIIDDIYSIAKEALR